MTDDVLDRLEAAGAEDRRLRAEDRKAARKSDKAKVGRRARRRGRDFERRACAYLGGVHDPFSGAMRANAADGEVYALGVRLLVECKKTSALRVQRRWLEGADLLVQSDPGESVDKALVVMRADLARDLLAAAKGGGADE